MAEPKVIKVTNSLSGLNPGEASGLATLDTNTKVPVAQLPEMGAASSSAAGTAGLVPASSAGDQAKFLRADKTWAAAGCTAVTFTLSTTWDTSGTYPTQECTATGLTADSNGVVGVAMTATKAQYDAAAAGQLRCTAQGTDTITITAYGTQPTVEIPCVVMIM